MLVAAEVRRRPRCHDSDSPAAPAFGSARRQIAPRSARRVPPPGGCGRRLARAGPNRFLSTCARGGQSANRLASPSSSGGRRSSWSASIRASSSRYVRTVGSNKPSDNPQSAIGNPQSRAGSRFSAISARSTTLSSSTSSAISAPVKPAKPSTQSCAPLRKSASAIRLQASVPGRPIDEPPAIDWCTAEDQGQVGELHRRQGRGMLVRLAWRASNPRRSCRGGALRDRPGDLASETEQRRQRKSSNRSRSSDLVDDHLPADRRTVRPPPGRSERTAGG